MEPAVVQGYIDGLTGYTGVQAATLAALKQLERWAIVRKKLPRQITLGVEIEESDGGHVPWTDEQVALAEKHSRPDIARAITLGANTGQRGSDLIRMGWSDIETFKGVDGINVVQQKTGREVWVPITPALASAMATWEKKPGPFLARLDGSRWTRPT
jgi:integrase